MPQILYMLYTSGAINQIYGIIVISILVVVPWQWIKVKKALIYGVSTSSFVALLIFSISYVLIGELNIQGFEFYLVCPLLAFVCGWVTVEVGKGEPEKIIKYSIYFMLIGYAVHAALNYSINIGRRRWELVDYFTGVFRAATGSGCINTIIFSLSAYFIVLEKNKLIKTAGIAGTILSLLYALLLGTRTQFLILFIVTVAFLFFYLRERYKWTGILRLGLAVAVLIGIYLYLYNTNTFGVRTYVQTSNLSERYTYRADLNRADDYRLSSITRGLNNVLIYPFGGLKDTEYYHSLWLDVGRVSGIIPFVAMIAYTVIVDIHAFRIIRNKEHADWFRYLVFCVYLGIQINFFTEPILEGLIGFFLVFLLINGMIECYYYKYELSKPTVAPMR